MNKTIKLLVESFFDDDDLFGGNNDVNDDLQDLGEYYEFNSLHDCTSLEDIYYYINKSLRLEESIRWVIFNQIPILKKESSIYKQLENSDLPFNINYYRQQFNIQFNYPIGTKLNIIIKNNYTADDLIYRNRPYTGDMVCLQTGNDITLPIGFLIEYYTQAPKYIFDPIILNQDNKNPKLIKLLEDYNKNLLTDDVITEFVHKFIDFYFNPKRLLEEITVKGKVYPVTQKDIDRMDKCLYTDNYAGFDAIKKPEKMVARLAALYILVNKRKHIDELEIKDDLLYKIVNDKIYRSKAFGRYYDSTYRLLAKVNLFNNIHVNDVIATYNAYKDKF